MQSPVDCTVGPEGRCYIQHYVDRDPGPARRDHMCRSSLTYDGHGGTDFALRSLADMARGVSVLAAAPGTVRAVRDGMADIAYDPARDAARVEGRDCGNGVVIDHADGWQTQYCHLRQGSVTVTPQMTVAAGTVLGLIGMSGRADFPHLHLHLRRDGVALDPFAPNTEAGCGDRTGALFAQDFAYAPGGLIAAGFAPDVPDYAQIKAGTAHHPNLSAAAPGLVLWGFAYGTEPGDVLALTITGPDGATVFEAEARQTREQAQMFRAGGRRTEGAEWFGPGLYQGRVEMRRGATVIDARRTELRITSR